MIESAQLRSHYSAEVRLHLQVGDRRYRLGKIGPDVIWMRQPLDLPPCRGQVIMTIDDYERRWDVELIDGAVPFDRNVRIRHVSAE